MTVRKKISDLYSSVCLCVLLCIPIGTSAAEPSVLWKMLANGEAVALMRHALAPGNGDPTDFVLGECSTQRNLSDEGVAQGLRIGEMFRENLIKEANLFSSQWCRCMDTASALKLGDTKALPIVNSFYQNRASEYKQTSELRDWIKLRLENAKNTTTLPAVLVTHQVNITSLTGVFPSSGEIIFVSLQEDNLVALGSLKTLP